MTTMTHTDAPALEIRPVTTSIGWTYRGPHFVTVTRLMAPLDAADAWLRQPGQHTLLDYGIDRETGRTLRWNDPFGPRAGWANGPFRSEDASSDGHQIVQRFGIDGVNTAGASIGVSGGFDDLIEDAAYQQLVALIGWHAAQAGVGTRDARFNYQLTGVPFIMTRMDFCGDQGDPGSVIREMLPRLKDDVRSWLGSRS